MKKTATMVLLALGLALPGSAQAMKKLFVGNLPYHITSAQVHRLVSRFGPVMSVIVMGTDRDGESWAEATVAFDRPRDADAAAAALDGRVIRGVQIVANTKEVLVVGSKVKEVIREAGLRSDGELVQAVSDKVHELLDAAIGRAIANRRSTVRPYDL